MRMLLVAALLAFAPMDTNAQTMDGPATAELEMRRMHARIIAAHLERSVDDWMALEADTLLSVNGGEMTFPVAADRRAQRAAYFASTTFTSYRDLKEPVVRVAGDASLGWLAAEVEVIGTRRGEDGRESAVRDIFAWVELYARAGNAWKLVGIASNRR